ncbi:DUF4412 domain-containing protein [Entomobacter blattae]|uniref:Uncharacterized protein n=1 Tax=Entomobacter blattae TaxID=2762277 RepID=A0A7H1NNI2_9PROT|nr:DUF4412 domain-containing protein [Entomobacter blattae]QNT77342.1 hypothetical protein JGUZn3_00750 [Entomobacter blattae]
MKMCFRYVYGSLLISSLVGVALPVMAAEDVPISSSSVSNTLSAPPLMPQKDVTVTYLVQAEDQPKQKSVKIYFSGKGDLLRIDEVDGQGQIVLDRKKQLITIIMNADRVYTQISKKKEIRNPFLLDSSMRFQQQGRKQLVGQACTVWQIQSDHGESIACVTDDGVVLQQDGADGAGVKGHLIAQSVVYGTLPVALFEPPAGYERRDPPKPGEGVAKHVDKPENE